MRPSLQNLGDLVLDWVYCRVSAQLGFTTTWFGSGFKNNFKSNYVSFVQHTTKQMQWPAVTCIEICSPLWFHYVTVMQHVPGPELRHVVAPHSLKWWRVAPYREGKIQFSRLLLMSGFSCWCLGGAWQGLSLGVPTVACCSTMPPRIRQGLRTEGIDREKIISMP